MSTGELRLRLAEIDRDIVFHEIQLGLLRAERESTQRHLHTVAVYPVLTLPNEITSQIFIQWIYTDDKSNPMLLTWVCQLWRAVAISTPQVWARLRNLPHGKKFFSKWLSHTGNLPLKLNLAFKGPSQVNYQDSFVFRTLSRHSSQLETLNLTTDGAVTLPPGPFPRLKKLCISSIKCTDRALVIDDTAPLAAPQLRELILKYSAELSGDALQVYLPCMQLTNLELRANATECLKFLVRALNLEHLIVDSEDGELPDLNQWTLVTLPRLRSIQCSTFTCPELLSYVTLPALEELSIWLDPEWSEIVQQLIARSQCSIHKLDVHAYFAGHGVWRRFLELPGFESIRDLTLRGPDGRDRALERLFQEIEHEPYFLPLLESFTIQGCDFFVPLHAVVDMLCARTKGEVQLKSFQLLFGGDDDDHEGWEGAQVDCADETVGYNLDQLDALCVQGLKINIQSKFKFWQGLDIDPSIIEAFRNRRDKMV
ncbi:hypothetical protein FB45DRAFT_999529 [Roridomyces roridus]|uniref:F-box domain-containing protein n=1 Tax=Roridomyces roridus TaxID=1738132 RepID=A0AAD7CBM3_9AGAR|nr:hypothetical protein FB45DRAFT_999529 [Roridomyces roridus]